MSTEVDLQQLAIDRGNSSGAPRAPRRHLLTRYVFPGLLLTGFLALVAWASRDLIFPPRPVTVVPVLATQAKVQRAGTPLFKAAGWIEPRPTAVRAAALAPGVVEELLVVEDQPVKKGQPVAEMVKDDARLAYEKAEADLQLRQAELEQAQAALQAATTRYEQPVHLQAALGEAEAALAKVNTQLRNLPFEIDQAAARLAFARSDYEGKLSAAGAVSGRAIDEAKSQMDSAQALLDGMRDRHESLTNEQSALASRRDALRTQLELLADEIKAKDEAAAQVKAADARVQQMRTALAEAKLQLDRMTVRAPVDGRVFRLIAVPGTRIGGGMTQMIGHDGSTVVTMYRPESLQVRVDVRFEDIPKVSLGQPVEIDNPALESPLIGRVLFISSEANIQKNTLDVKVAIDSLADVFKPEMLVDVTFLAPQEADRPVEPSDETRLYLPQNLIQQDEGGKFIWLADQSAHVARRQPVQTGAASNAGLVEVASGLTPSARIIASGIEGLRDGMRIRITGEQAPLASGNTPAMKRGSLNRLPTGGE